MMNPEVLLLQRKIAGYELKRITPIVGGLGVSVYTIGYELRNLFNVDM